MVATPVEFQTVPTGADTDTTVPGIWNIPSEGRELAEGYGSIDLSPGETNVITFDMQYRFAPEVVFEESETPFLAGINPLYGTINVVDANAGIFSYRISFADWVSYGSPELITIRFDKDVGDASVITIPAEYYLTITCFAAGTDIATPTGSTAVEALQPGDMITTADGRDIPVVWVFRQTVSTVFAETTDRLRLVRIAAGALGGGLPDRDLRVTADHAMLVGGMLINAGALVNGATIAFEPVSTLAASYEVFHIETEAHDLLLAEGAATESYVDYDLRRSFDNHAAYIARYGEGRIIPEMQLPRIGAARLLPPDLRDRLGIARAA